MGPCTGGERDRENDRRRSGGASLRGDGERDIELRFRECELPPMFASTVSPGSGVGSRTADSTVAILDIRCWPSREWRSVDRKK